MMDEQLHRLTKDYLMEVCPNPEFKRTTKKPEILAYVLTQMQENEVLRERIYKDNLDVFSVHPTQLEEVLALTTSQRKRYIMEGKLNVVAEDSISLHGRTVTVQRIDLKQVVYLMQHPEIIETWEQEHKEKISQNRKKAAKQSQITKQANDKERDNFKAEFKATLRTWNKLGLEVGAFLELAFWTMWVSRWAKNYQQKAFNGTSRTREKYSKMKAHYYQLKNEALRVLSQSPYAKVSFYRPKDAHKISNLTLCQPHYELWCLEREYVGYYSKWDYYECNREAIDKCPYCTQEIIKDYYSLFVLDIGVPDLDTSFCFHTPYSLGVSMFPPIDTLPRKKHTSEQEGMFRFGRPLTGQEQIVFTERYTLTNFTKALEKCKLYMDSQEPTQLQKA